MIKCPFCNINLQEFQRKDITSQELKLEKIITCNSCGKVFSLTDAVIESTASMIQQHSELSEDDKKILKDSLPDIMIESPNTKAASLRAKKTLGTTGIAIAEVFFEVIFTFGSEIAQAIFEA